MHSPANQAPLRDPTLTVQCLFFGRYAETVGRAACALELPAPAAVADAVRTLRRDLGADRLPERPLVAVNREHSAMDRVLADGDEVAFLPPMAGG